MEIEALCHIHNKHINKINWWTMVVYNNSQSEVNKNIRDNTARENIFRSRVFDFLVHKNWTFHNSSDMNAVDGGNSWRQCPCAKQHMNRVKVRVSCEVELKNGLFTLMLKKTPWVCHLFTYFAYLLLAYSTGRGLLWTLPSYFQTSIFSKEILTCGLALLFF